MPQSRFFYTDGRWWVKDAYFTHCQHAESLLAIDVDVLEASVCVHVWELRFIGLKCSCRDGKFPFCPETETTAAYLEVTSSTSA